MYVPSMGRFLTRDTWTGNYNQPMSYNRWNYTYSNPISFTDPLGKFPLECLVASNFADCLRDWRLEKCFTNIQNLPEIRQRERIKSLGIILEPEEKWTGEWLANLTKVLFRDIGADAVRRWMNHKSATLFIDKEGSAICSNGGENCYSGKTGSDKITFYHTGTSINSEINMLHEFGHLVDNLSDSGNDFTDRLRSQTFTLSNEDWAGWNGNTYVSIPASGANNVYQLVLKTSPIGGDRAWQQGGGTPHWEDWADIFANGILHNIKTSTEPGGQIEQFFGDMKRYALSR